MEYSEDSQCRSFFTTNILLLLKFLVQSLQCHSWAEIMFVRHRSFSIRPYMDDLRKRKTRKFLVRNERNTRCKIKKTRSSARISKQYLSYNDRSHLPVQINWRNLEMVTSQPDALSEQSFSKCFAQTIPRALPPLPSSLSLSLSHVTNVCKRVQISETRFNWLNRGGKSFSRHFRIVQFKFIAHSLKPLLKPSVLNFGGIGGEI